MTALDILETLISKKLGKIELEIHSSHFSGIGKLGITGIRFGKDCYVKIWKSPKSSIDLDICYKHYSKHQNIEKDSLEHSKLIISFLKIEEYILEKDELEFLTFLNN